MTLDTWQLPQLPQPPQLPQLPQLSQSKLFWTTPCCRSRSCLERPLVLQSGHSMNTPRRWLELFMTYVVSCDLELMLLSNFLFTFSHLRTVVTLSWTPTCSIDEFDGTRVTPKLPGSRNTVQIVCKSITTVFMNILSFH